MCIYFFPEQWKCCTKLTQLFLFYFLVRAHSARVEWNWNCGLFRLSFFVIIFNISGWQLRGSNTYQKGYDWVSWSFVFLGMCLWVGSSKWNKKGGLSWAPAHSSEVFCSSFWLKQQESWRASVTLRRILCTNLLLKGSWCQEKHRVMGLLTQMSGSSKGSSFHPYPV